MALKPEHAKLSGYFNLDNGSGKIRGVYLQGHEAMRPLFEQWLAPFRDLGVDDDHHPEYRRHRSPVLRRAWGFRASSSSRIRSTTAPSRITPARTPTTTRSRRSDAGVAVIAALSTTPRTGRRSCRGESCRRRRPRQAEREAVSVRDSALGARRSVLVLSAALACWTSEPVTTLVPAQIPTLSAGPPIARSRGPIRIR